MSVTLNEVRRGFYVDSVALMRLSRQIATLDGVEEAALMMGTPANHEIMSDAGLMADAGRQAGPGDLIVGVRAGDEAQARAALEAGLTGLDSPKSVGAAAAWRPKSLRAALSAEPGAGLALISVPGAFAAAEAMKALRNGLSPMIFSDNVPLEDEVALKREADQRGLIVMGPDCGTAIIGGLPLAFANAVPSGDIGIVGASGTGIQEVACLIAQWGGGISHAIGVGGRDLKSEVGGISTLAAIDALTRDGGTRNIVLIAKPPGANVAARVLERLSGCGKPAVVCLMGADAMTMPEGVRQVFTLRDAAAAALGRTAEDAPATDLTATGPITGLFSGGTLCAEAQVILLGAGLSVGSNAPVAGVASAPDGDHQLLDLGADEYTQGRPHPMIDPAVRNDMLAKALAADGGIVLLDLVIGTGAHEDPAGQLAGVVKARTRDGGPALIASVTGTDADAQNRTAQIAVLQAAGILVAPSNADAARWAVAAIQR